MAFDYEYSFNKFIDFDKLSEFNSFLKNFELSSVIKCGISSINNTVTIITNTELTGDQQNTLNNLVQSFTPSNTSITEEQSFIINTTPYIINTTVWQNQFSWIYPGSASQSFKKVRFIANINNSNATYSVRLYNKNNNTNLFNYTGSNVNTEIITVDTLENIPSELSTLEFHGKVSVSNVNLYLNSVSIIV